MLLECCPEEGLIFPIPGVKKLLKCSLYKQWKTNSKKKSTVDHSHSAFAKCNSFQHSVEHIGYDSRCKTEENKNKIQKIS